MRDQMNRFRNKLVYDANTGEIRDDRKHMSMLEDYWLPRREVVKEQKFQLYPVVKILERWKMFFTSKRNC
jgi:hypothetical protein